MENVRFRRHTANRLLPYIFVRPLSGKVDQSFFTGKPGSVMSNLCSTSALVLP